MPGTGPFDVVVVGGGHAGIEAAAASARLGRRTALVTANLDTIGKMSCNPAIGGIAKGQLAREIDALGGLMGRAADATGIQFRLLNRSKGPALWSPRAQCDKAAYAAWMKLALETTPDLLPIQGEAWEVVTGPERQVRGLRLRDGRLLATTRLVVTTGTFLRGLLHQGECRTPGGRMGDGPAEGLSASLAALGLRLIRLKTGTPCRLHADTIRWELCERQPGDQPPVPFSFLTGRLEQTQVDCWSTRTTPEAHAAIHANLHRAPLYNGQIASTGPRYCPSIEDKVVRFADRGSHHLFLEPEGRATREVYVNGLATSLPLDVQDAVLAAIPALAGAHVLRHGYAVEYDAVAPDQLDHRLAVRSVEGLFLAGQTNGTSGYEEAAAQGLVAGANAALSLDGRELLLTRADAYIGVLVDDLVTRVPDEPYRMFTSRAEHRLHLRADNADLRLTPIGGQLGLVEPARAARTAAKQAALDAALGSLPRGTAARVAGEGLDLAATRRRLPTLAGLDPEVMEQVWISLRYATYLERQHSVLERRRRNRALPLPADLDWRQVPALSWEGRQRLMLQRPRSLGEAEMLSGVTQADLENLWAWLGARSGGTRDGADGG